MGHLGRLHGAYPFLTQISPEEQQAIVKGLDDPTPLQASGIYANGKKYLTLQANPRSIYGKSGVRILANAG